MKRARQLLAVLALPGLMALALPARADLYVVVNQDSPLRELTPSQVSDLYLGRARSLPGSGTLTVIERERDSGLRSRFFRALNGMSLNQVNAYWARLQFSGQVLPPPSLDETKSLIAAIRVNRMAIGYVDAAEADDSLRVILRLREAP